MSRSNHLNIAQYKNQKQLPILINSTHQQATQTSYTKNKQLEKKIFVLLSEVENQYSQKHAALTIFVETLIKSIQQQQEQLLHQLQQQKNAVLSRFQPIFYQFLKFSQQIRKVYMTQTITFEDSFAQFDLELVEQQMKQMKLGLRDINLKIHEWCSKHAPLLNINTSSQQQDEAVLPSDVDISAILKSESINDIGLQPIGKQSFESIIPVNHDLQMDDNKDKPLGINSSWCSNIVGDEKVISFKTMNNKASDADANHISSCPVITNTHQHAAGQYCKKEQPENQESSTPLFNYSINQHPKQSFRSDSLTEQMAPTCNLISKSSKQLNNQPKSIVTARIRTLNDQKINRKNHEIQQMRRKENYNFSKDYCQIDNFHLISSLRQNEYESFSANLKASSINKVTQQKFHKLKVQVSKTHNSQENQCKSNNIKQFLSIYSEELFAMKQSSTRRNTLGPNDENSTNRQNTSARSVSAKKKQCLEILQRQQCKFDAIKRSIE